MTEPWLRGPITGVYPALTPLLYSLVSCSEDLPRAVEGIDMEQLWFRPGGAASIGFHLRHIAGALDRLLTYANGDQLTADQVAAARSEIEPGDPVPDTAVMLQIALNGLSLAMDYVRSVPESHLYLPREVGRAKLPSTVFGLLLHCAEHSQRHTGQLITTAKIVKGLQLRA